MQTSLLQQDRGTGERLEPATTTFVESPSNREPPASEISPLDSQASPAVYSQRPSTYEAADQVFRQSYQASGLLSAADAIPGGSSIIRQTQQKRIELPLGDVLGTEVPPIAIIDFLLDTYLSSVHWFMSVIHEPTLRAEIHDILARNSVPDHRRLVPILMLVILAFSARYAQQDAVKQILPGYDLLEMEPLWIKRVEEKLLDVLEDGGIEAVQIAIILKSYYLYGNRPKRSFAILGAGIKVALSMKLHLEGTWTVADPVRREVRRRVWWSLYVADVWAATIYGTPCNIHDDDWEVELPGTIDDGIPRCPMFNSEENFDGRTFGPVTIFSYQRYKFRLYKIAFSIINNVYTHQRVSLADTIGHIKRLDQRLLYLESQIPPELRLGTIDSNTATYDETVKVFQRQALVLQLSLDNFKLLLHRPLLTLNRLQRPLMEPPRAVHSSNDPETHVIDEMIKVSKYRCWDAAVRTSRIGRFTRTLSGTRYTLGASYIMIQAFTAAIALGIFALSDPASRQAYEAKGAISKIMGFPKIYGYRSVMFDQCTAILEELIRLILNAEMRSLVSNTTRDATPTELGTNAFPTQGKQISASEATDTSAVQHSEDALPRALPSLNMVEDISYGNFSDALLSLHDAFNEARHVTGVAPATENVNMPPGQGIELQPDGGLGSSAWAFGTESQGWIWDEFWQVQDLPFSQLDPS
ncbi:uncharacterized protein HMPREF1541_09384 [Cyphellophora europaea CBS 101466]|uniref:Xylanolytic transcriptional activator regulatory domain-containing protein n=1 Tax=Cyphellophora europaea (strain CBS 101466) TaxID=1220924 RepID=W2SA31_CYPE1|nr:uncharacterized protein HMPREF1541_09384 [Cyphellophora europaea CBS 101466]ETN45552.1 hypothetical protein HMPREF1541_09384 [Cyphellophora europaea CBS 101466]